MKNLNSLTIGLFAAVLIFGCGKNSEVWSEKSGGIKAALHIEIALRTPSFEVGDSLRSGEYSILSSHVIPVDSDGGAGHHISQVDGVSLELSWDSVTAFQSRIDQRAVEETRIEFDQMQVKIGNPIVGPNGVSHRVASGPGSLVLTSEYELIISPLRFQESNHEGGQDLIIRARVLDKAPPVKDITLSGVGES